jgi:hypothetical protein
MKTSRYHRLTEKVIGFSILTLYLGVFAGFSGQQISFPSQFRARLVLVCALLNVISHMAVIWNCLNDVYVISILVGVGFDTLSSALYLQSSISTHSSPSWLLWLWLLGDFCMHLRALFLYTSVDRVESVVTSATNNLQGNPGPYCMDHFFAYTDNGKHLLFWITAMQTCGWKVSLQISAVIVTLVLAMDMILYYFYYNRRGTTSTTRKTPAARLSTSTCSKNTNKQRKPRPICDCHACRNQTAFSIVPSLCDLWLCTFEELLQKIDQTKKVSPS